MNFSILHPGKRDKIYDFHPGANENKKRSWVEVKRGNEMEKGKASKLRVLLLQIEFFCGIYFFIKVLKLFTCRQSF